MQQGGFDNKPFGPSQHPCQQTTKQPPCFSSPPVTTTTNAHDGSWTRSSSLFRHPSHEGQAQAMQNESLNGAGVAERRWEREAPFRFLLSFLLSSCHNLFFVLLSSRRFYGRSRSSKHGPLARGARRSPISYYPSPRKDYGAITAISRTRGPSDEDEQGWGVAPRETLRLLPRRDFSSFLWLGPCHAPCWPPAKPSRPSQGPLKVLFHLTFSLLVLALFPFSSSCSPFPRLSSSSSSPGLFFVQHVRFFTHFFFVFCALSAHHTPF